MAEYEGKKHTGAIAMNAISSKDNLIKSDNQTFARYKKLKNIFNYHKAVQKDSENNEQKAFLLPSSIIRINQ